MAKKRKATVYFDDDVWDVLENKMKMSKNANISSAINDAVRYAAYPEHREDRDADLHKKLQLVQDSFVQHRKKTARDLAFIQETILEQLQELYRHFPEIPEDKIKEKNVQAKSRAMAFVKHIAQNMNKLQSFSDKEMGE
tara:strand:+ start:1246 stop:1662 length:417 start_codon:yes stop_codon:yes gene_type:complete